MSALLRRVEGGGDLGTANIAIVVLDEDNQPVAGVMYPSNVVKDGVVVDYLTASRVVARLKQILEQKQGCTLERAAIAVPPGISEGKFLQNLLGNPLGLLFGVIHNGYDLIIGLSYG